VRAAFGALGVVCLLIGCGGTSGDLIAFEVTGGHGPVTSRLVLTSDGRGRCGEGELRTIPNDRLIEARAVERDLTDLATVGREFAGGDEPRFVARTKDGIVRWGQGAEGLPEALPRAARLALLLERELCRGG